MTFYYIDADTVRTINYAFCGDGAGVRDESGFLGIVERPQTTWGDQDMFPDAFSKAAAYLHGFATTQYFFDGNKRTGFLTATVFLDIHGIEWHGPSVDDAEDFLLDVAANHHNEHDVAQWLEQHCAVPPSEWEPPLTP